MSLNPIVRVPLSTVVSSWNPDSLPVRLETIAASSTRERTGVDPCADRHAAGELQRGRVAKVHEVICAIEQHCIAIFSGREGRTIGERADDGVARRIGRRGAGDLIERIASGDAQGIRGQKEARLERLKDQWRAGRELAGGIRITASGVLALASRGTIDETVALPGSPTRTDSTSHVSRSMRLHPTQLSSHRTTARHNASINPIEANLTPAPCVNLRRD